MKLGIVIVIAVFVLLHILLNKVFGENLNRIAKVILYGFTPLGILMWLSEIYISKHVSIMQFGLVFIAFCLLSFIMVKFTKYSTRKFSTANGKAIGFCYSLVIILMILLFVFTSGYIGTYFKHAYLFP